MAFDSGGDRDSGNNDRAGGDSGGDGGGNDSGSDSGRDGGYNDAEQGRNDEQADKARGALSEANGAGHDGGSLSPSNVVPKIQDLIGSFIPGYGALKTLAQVADYMGWSDKEYQAAKDKLGNTRGTNGGNEHSGGSYVGYGGGKPSHSNGAGSTPTYTVPKFVPYKSVKFDPIYTGSKYAEYKLPTAGYESFNLNKSLGDKHMMPTYNGSPYGQPQQQWGNPYGQPQQQWGNPYGQPQQQWGNPYGQPQQQWGNPYGQPQQQWGNPYGQPQQQWGQPQQQWGQPQQQWGNPYGQPQWGGQQGQQQRGNPNGHPQQQGPYHGQPTTDSLPVHHGMLPPLHKLGPMAAPSASDMNAPPAALNGVAGYLQRPHPSPQQQPYGRYNSAGDTSLSPGWFPGQPHANW
jgi:hypothetical protein